MAAVEVGQPLTNILVWRLFGAAVLKTANRALRHGFGHTTGATTIVAIKAKTLEIRNPAPERRHAMLVLATALARWTVAYLHFYRALAIIVGISIT